MWTGRMRRAAQPRERKWDRRSGRKWGRSGAGSGNMAAALERWVAGELQELLGMSGRHVPAFLVALARRSRSVEDLLERLRETEALRVEEPRVREFARELWGKVRGPGWGRGRGFRGRARSDGTSLSIRGFRRERVGLPV